MIIESLKLKNYRQYLDEKIIFAKPEDNKNFTVIQGVTGAGKTNILNAITWCFYGNEKHLGEKYRGLPVISVPTLEKIKPNENSQVEVEIQMLDEELNRMIFRRTLTFRKSDDGDIRSIPDPLSNSPDGSKFEMMRQIKKEMIAVSSPIYVLGRLIPESLEEYFFFDGERLNDYFKESGNKIREEVFKISQLDLLEEIVGLPL